MNQTNIPTLTFSGDLDMWLHLVKSLLRERNLWAAVNGTAADPNWRTNNEAAIGIISRHVSPEMIPIDPEPQTAMDLLTAVKTAFNARLGDRKRSTKEWLSATKYIQGTCIRAYIADLDRHLKQLEQCQASYDDEEKGHLLIRVLPATRDRRFEGLKSSLASALVRQEPYDVMTRLVIQEVTRIELEFQERPQVHALKSSHRFGRSERGNGRAYFNKRGGHQRGGHRQQSFTQRREAYPARPFNAGQSCGWCGRRNHVIDDCRAKAAYEKRNNDNKQDEAVTANIANALISNVEHEVSQQKNGYIKFIIDSGASHHIINIEKFAENFPTLNNPIKIGIAGKNQFIYATKMGTLHISTELGYTIALDDVLFCREGSINAISLNRLRKIGFSIFSWPNESKIFKDQTLVSNIDDLGNLMYLDWEIITCSSLFTCNISQSDADFALWHRRLGHLNNDKLRQIIRNNLFKDTKIISDLKTDKKFCEPCILAKQTRIPTNKIKDKNDIKNRPLLRIHSDVCSISPTAMNGYNHFVTFIDDFTHYCFAYLIKQKSDVFKIFKDYVAKAEVNFSEEGHRIKFLYCDNGGEYLSNEMRDFLSEKGITYHLTSPHTSSQNGVAERMNRTIQDKKRALLKTAELSPYFWGCAVSVAVHILNRTPTKAIPSDTTPYELWHKKRPELKYLKLFGATAYYHNKTPSGKCEDRAIKGILVGFEPSGYKIYNPVTRRIAVSKDVTFDEVDFLRTRPTLSSEIEEQSSEPKPQPGTPLSTDFIGAPKPQPGMPPSPAPMQLRSDSKTKGPIPEGEYRSNQETTNIILTPRENILIPDTSIILPNSSANVEENSNTIDSTPSRVTNLNTDESSDPITSETPNKTHQATNSQDDSIIDISTQIDDNHISQDEINTSPMETCNIRPLPSTSSSDNSSILKRKSDSSPPQIDPKVRRSERIQKYQDDVPYLKRLYKDCILVANSIQQIPKSFSDVQNQPDADCWMEAINDELNSLRLNDTWDIVDKPQDKNIVACRWVFSIKSDKFGNPSKYKARLVAKGFTQEYMIDYNETYAPVARIPTFRMIMTIANEHNLLVHHMDVKTAFLNGEIDAEIFMKIPQGIPNHPNKVCKLKKSIYGLKQSARCWYDKFDKVIKNFGFKSSHLDNCLYVREAQNIKDSMYVVLYVDDLVIVTGNIESMNLIKQYFMNIFEMKDLNEIKLFLGMRITRTPNTIAIDQESYIQTVLNKFNMANCNPASIPMENRLDCETFQSEIYYDAPCRSLLGCLIYISICTRPDIAVSVNMLSRYVERNNYEIWQALKRVLSYLKGTMHLKLTYTRSNGNQNFLTAYADAKYAGDIDSKSTSGHIFKMFGNAVIDWKAKKQTVVATSTTEAEFVSLFHCIESTLYYRELLRSIGLKYNNPVTIYEDNQACISIATNPNPQTTATHLRVKYHYMFETLQNNELIEIKYIKTDLQLADALTKPLPTPLFRQHRNSMNLQ